MRSLLANAHVVTMDDAGTEHAHGWILFEDGFVTEVGTGAEPEADEREDLAGAVVTPGLVNTHHHLYQTLTRARAQQATLFEWLVELYPTWARIDAEAEYAAARTGLAELMLSGCSTVFDHHYVFPRGREGLVEAEVQAARELGCRIVASRGSMDLGVSDGGLPPDELVEDIDAVLADTERLAGELHESGRGARVQIAVAPCSPVLRHRPADDRVGRASRAGTGCSSTRTSPRRSRRRRTAASSTAAARSSTSTGSAGSTATSGARTASTSRSRRSRASPRPAPASRTARPPTSASAPASRRVRDDARRGRARRPGRRRLGLERAQRPLLRREAGAARRARARRPAGDDGKRRAEDRDARRRGRPRARRPRRDRAGHVRRPGRLGDRRARARRRRGSGRRARARPGRSAPTGCTSAASSS